MQFYTKNDPYKFIFLMSQINIYRPKSTILLIRTISQGIPKMVDNYYICSPVVSVEDRAPKLDRSKTVFTGRSPLVMTTTDPSTQREKVTFFFYFCHGVTCVLHIYSSFL